MLHLCSPSLCRFLLFRSGQALFGPAEARLEIYVDDPLHSKEPWLSGQETLLSPCSGCCRLDLTCRGPKPRGARRRPGSEPRFAVIVTLPAEFITKLLKNISAAMGIQGWTGDCRAISDTQRTRRTSSTSGSGAMLEPIRAVTAEYASKARHPQGARIPVDGQGASTTTVRSPPHSCHGHLFWRASLRCHRRCLTMVAGRISGVQREASGMVCRPSSRSRRVKFGIVIGSQMYQTLLKKKKKPLRNAAWWKLQGNTTHEPSM